MSSAVAMPFHTGSMPSAMRAFGGYFKPQAISHTAPTIFIVDDDMSIQESLERLISAQGWQPQVCDSAREFLARPRVMVPSAVILGFSSSHQNSLEVQKRIAKEWPQTPVIVIADYEDIPTAVEAMRAGAIDFLLKPISEELLLPAIHQSLARSRAVLDRGMEMRDLRNSFDSLTPREQQVMALVASGLANKQAGAELGISEITIKAHRGQVMQKMKADSFAHLVKMASRLRVSRTMAPSAFAMQ